jgi:hypothetical protein
MKIKTGRLFLALEIGLSATAMVTGITGCVSDEHPARPNESPFYYQSTLRVDEHAIPVYTSPTVTPATNQLLDGKTPP